MWLLNHGAARRFEIPMLKACGFDEIFLPKSYPADPGFRSASVDFTEDRNLTVPAEDLAILNAADWYGNPGVEAWKVANRHFGLLFFILHKADILNGISRHFRGAAIWRAYGLELTKSYSAVRHYFGDGMRNIENIGDRFWFGEAYQGLSEIEEEKIKKKRIYLPLGIYPYSSKDEWNGNDRRVFFICPDIGFNNYYCKIYREFKRDFSGVPYVIGGSQPVVVNDPHVLGFVPGEMHERNMRELRVMFYHSREPRHVHYHPFEAVRAGMPLVFMADGMLDKLGGKGLPGRARTIVEAREKVQRLLGGDMRLAAEIRATQVRLLDAMKPERLLDTWRMNLAHIVDRLESSQAADALSSPRKKRIGVVVPVGYRGGSLRAAKLLAQAIFEGAEQAGEAVDVVLAHLDEPGSYSAKDWADVPPSIKVRSFQWRNLDATEALRAMRYAGHSEWKPKFNDYLVIEDGIKQFCDCDLWVVISDRLVSPLLPLRPSVVMVFDYLQRHYDVTTIGEMTLLANRNAEHVLVTTEFSRQDALQYAGIRADKVTKVPMLAPEKGDAERRPPGAESHYFLWTTNLGPHKNQRRALAALQIYYEVYNGRLDCRVTGVGSDNLTKSKLPNLRGLDQIVGRSPMLRRKVKFLGELSEALYRRQLSAAAFLWHPAELDNGTFSVIEAAHFGVPSLSSDYPAMREIDHQFQLGLSFMDQEDPEDMARRIHEMEVCSVERERALANAEQLTSQSVSHLAPAYWNVLRELL
ncbi:glycosytransferase [Mesorhizobium australicum]|uniref:glycosyltransferase n=1 Tax=Mesorhizobium australicum TaxID=536018 RepID=UPI0033367586